jgi:hypothetical protein
VIYCQFSLDGGNTWGKLTKNVWISSKGAQLSGWSDVLNGAKSDVLVRAVSKGGANMNVDIQSVHLQVK